MNKNMYLDSVKQWNCIVGCYFDCVYCHRSFQAQMRRQQHHCLQCYTYEPHFHPERLHASLPETHGDQFIWACSSSDISFAESDWINAILDRIKTRMDRTFFFQTKAPKSFRKYDFPSNVKLGITLETDSDLNYDRISKAPPPMTRYRQFADLDCINKKIVTVEPILTFSYQELFLAHIKEIGPEIVYIGYDTKRTKLPEPRLNRVQDLMKGLAKFTKVKPKLLREPWNYRASSLEGFY